MPDEQDEPFEEVAKEERDLALLMHLLAFFTGFVGPLILWIIKKDESPFLDQHGKGALNFQISFLLYSFSIAVTIFVLMILTWGFGILLGFPVALLLGALYLVGCIMAAMQGNRGEPCKYPLTIPFLR